MRNLHLNSHSKIVVSEKIGKEFDLNPDSFQFHVASSPACITIYSSGKILSLRDDDNVDEVSIVEALREENISDDRLAGIEVTSEGNVVLATKTDGALLSVGPDGVSVVGQVDAGLVAISQSPDEELFIIVTEASSLILMTRDFDPLTEIPLDPADPLFRGEQAPISVGWGTKETQFHGKAGKSAAKAAGPPLVPVGPHDDRKFRIVWKEDGQHFAVSHISKAEEGIEVRRIRIFSREGVLQSTSEDVSGLEHALAWKPSGSLLASTVRLPNKHQVQFFEKNGLRHGEFNLPFAVNEVTVRSLSWNVDSSILMLLASDIESPNRFHLQLWTCSNFKWSLKKSWSFDQPILSVQWDQASPLKLHFMTSDGVYHCYDLTWCIDHSLGKTESDLAFVANIDGNVVGLTPFRQTVIPPPLSAFELRFKHKVSQVLFGPPAYVDSNSVLVLTENRDLFLFGPDQVENKEQGISDMVQITGAGGRGFTVRCSCLYLQQHLTLNSDYEIENVTWLKKDLLLASRSHPIPELLVFKLENDVFSLADSHPCEEVIFSISGSSCGKIAAIQLTNGAVLKCRINDNDDDEVELLPWTTSDENSEENPVQFPTVCIQLKIAFNLNAKIQHRLFGISARNRLYCDDVEISTGISSFFLHTNYLLATTLTHSLKALPLIQTIFNQKCSAQTFWESESVRSLERGSRLVVAVPESTQTVLQMPRGNLEVVHPRALSLYIVKKLLDNLKYREAMEILRKQRINLNLIVDHNPDLFIENIEKFIEQITDKQRLCLFLADLLDENTTTTMYKSMYTDSKPYNWPRAGMKVDAVCRKMEQVLKRDTEENFLPILSCLVRNSEAKIDTALIRIQDMREKNSRLADEGLHFLLLLVDVQVLFDAALGLYDFDLVLFVAQKSQKDPKEYLQFLNELKKYPENYRKFKIDSHLKKFELALVHLVECGDPYLEECLNLITEHRLYTQALQIFQHGTRGFQEVCRIYGDYLLAKKYHEDSALIYEQGGMFTQAMGAWEKAVCPSYCLAVAKTLNLGPNEMTSLCRRLVDSLNEGKRHLEASHLLLEYLNDVEESVATLVNGQCWSEAQRLIVKHARADLLETHMMPKLKETAENVLSTIGRNRSSLIEQVDRLQVVMETKRKIASGLFDEIDVNLDDVDLYSDVTSHTGILSQQSRIKSNPASLQTKASSQKSKSSKNRRKHEKKKYSTKEGSAFEDIAIVAALHELISRVYAMTADVGRLTRALISNGESKSAKAIQTEFSNLLNEIYSCESKIWMDSAVSGCGGEEDDHKFGPEATTADIIKNNSQPKPTTIPYHLLEMRLRFPPTRPSSDSWKLIVLN